MPPRNRPARAKTRAVVRIDGMTLLVDDLTLAELREIEKETRVRWYELNPLVSADQAAAVLAAVLRRTMGRQEAQTRVDAMTLRETLTHVTLEEYEHEDDRPKDYVDGVPVVDPLAEPAATGTTSSS